jgi:hypothetical protein
LCVGSQVFKLAKTLQKNESFRAKPEFCRINPDNDEATYKAELAEFIEDLFETGVLELVPVLGIRIRSSCVFLGHPDPLVRGTDPGIWIRTKM